MVQSYQTTYKFIFSSLSSFHVVSSLFLTLAIFLLEAFDCWCHPFSSLIWRESQRGQIGAEAHSVAHVQLVHLFNRRERFLVANTTHCQSL